MKSSSPSYCSMPTMDSELRPDLNLDRDPKDEEKELNVDPSIEELKKKKHIKLSSPPSRVVDLCAAPGSWSQVLRQRLPSSSKIISVDLQPMAPLEGVTCIQGDITREETIREVEKALNQDEETSTSTSQKHRAELIVCDGANDVTGVGGLDEILQAQLLLAALQISLRLLSSGGTFISKIFTHSTSSDGNKDGRKEEGNSGSLLKSQFKTLFENVEIVKPISSRGGSGEHFLVCLGFRPSKDLGFGNDGKGSQDISLLKRATEVLGQEKKEESSLLRVMPFVASGDLSGYN